MDFQSVNQNNDRSGKSKSSTKQLQLHVASVYTQIAEMIKQKGDLQIQLPNDVPTAVERVNLIKSVLAFLLDQSEAKESKQSARGNNYAGKEQSLEQQNDISCINCQNYEKNLQKLEGEVRNHIRTHQQLKLYQDGLEQKIQQHKKEKKEFQKKYENAKKKYEEAKITVTASSEKLIKMEQQNEKLKLELKQLKQSPKVEEPRKQYNRYQSNKENLSQWKNTNFNERQRERSSLQKRPESTERMRVSINMKSTKGIPISSKIIQERTKEEKAKALKNRLGF